MAVTIDQQGIMARAYLGAGWDIQQAEPSGHLQALISGYVGRVSTTMTTLNQLVTSALSLIAFVGTGLFVNPAATGAMLLALAGLALILAPLRRRIRARAATQSAKTLAFAKAIAELGSLGQEMHTFGVRERFVASIAEAARANAIPTRRVQVLTGLLTPIYTFLAYVVVLGAVAILHAWGNSDLTAVGAAMLLLLRSLSYGQQLVSVAGTVSASLPFLHTVFETIDRYRAHRASGGNAIPSRSTPLSLSEVTFRYGPERPEALHPLAIELHSGELLGIIGPSGSGKSTLAQLLLGLREPTTGTATASGVDLRDIDRNWWTGHVAFVAQEPRLFTGTVSENIRFFREGLSDNDLRLAARRANILDDIEALPEGFSTHLGERADQLSGGQRQRISIARALVGQPDVLILDEPTSALDGQSEVLIRETLAALHGQVTIVIIAHRMSTLELCDRIMVIEKGTVTALDTPDRLREDSEFYRSALTISGLD